MESIDKKKESERVERRKSKELHELDYGHSVNRNLDLQKAIENEQVLFNPAKVSKRLDDYVSVDGQKTLFFSMNSPDLIESSFMDYLETIKVQNWPHAEKYKLRFMQPGTDNGGKAYLVDVVMRIYQVNSKQVCVEFLQQSGNRAFFLEHFEAYMMKLASFDDSIESTYA